MAYSVLRTRVHYAIRYMHQTVYFSEQPKKARIHMTDRLTLSPTYPDLAGKVALVTGGSRGIGAATCRLLAANGVKVVVNGRDQAAIDAVVGAIRTSGGRAIGVAADVIDFSAIEEMRRWSERE